MEQEPCEVCETLNSPLAPTCRGCNHPIASQKQKRKENNIAFKNLILLAVVAVAFYYASNAGLITKGIDYISKSAFNQSRAK